MSWRWWRRIRLPEPPAEADPLWHLNDGPGRPLTIDLPGRVRATVMGWLTPAIDVLVTPRGIRFILGNELLEADAKNLLPENAVELCGAIGVTIQGGAYGLPQDEELRRQIRRWIEGRIGRWLWQDCWSGNGEHYHTLLARLADRSPRFRRLCAQDTAWQGLARQVLHFTTSEGPRTIDQLTSHGEGDWSWTASIHPQTVRSFTSREPTRIVDLRRRQDFELFECLRPTTLLVRDAAPAPRPVESCVHSGEQHQVKRWLEEGLILAGKRYRRIMVTLQTSDDLANRTALVRPSRGTSGRLDTWVSSSVLYMNADSELARDLLRMIQRLKDDSEAKHHLPLLIHGYALMFSISDFSHEWEMELWQQVRRLVDHFEITGRMRDRLSDGPNSVEDWLEVSWERDRAEARLQAALQMMGEASGLF